jgi:hypothetical protein
VGGQRARCYPTIRFAGSQLSRSAIRFGFPLTSPVQRRS